MNLIAKENKKIKILYGELIRNKQEIKTESKSTKLQDSGCDFNFDQINITEQDKVTMFDDLLAYSTSLKLQILTSGGEPPTCKNKTIDSLI